MRLDRRHALAAALAAPAVVSAARLRAAAPQARRQAPGFYRLKVGDYEVTVVNDGINRRPNPGEGFVRNADKAAVEAALARDFLPTGHLDITFNITFVNTGRELILFDTGTGGNLAPTAGTMWENMQAAGIAPAQVDKIVFSHFHGDHVSGLVSREGQPRFPNAELIVPEAEWTFWMGERAPQQPAAMVKSRFAPYPAERIRRVASDAEVAPGIRGIPTFGHTPGHTTWSVQSGNGTLIVLGDVTNHPTINLRNPGWHAVFDMDAAMAEETRRRFFDRAAADRTPIIGYHWPFPAVGYVRKDGAGYDLVPIPWTSQV
ncbi:MBL fold metallo-hydrolase [Elioraea sp.]|uniref:MBL fold metallo-hydrolase n=1 Tax=Elioraea sp. TaxID=2185103 RepID=UPI0021DDB373|nr:MBL fold metallo-hydrolase [Elioraea sp.]GIX09631.1 MAG: MBL fold metallo-hydrolase [Elioraea sp.]